MKTYKEQINDALKKNSVCRELTQTESAALKSCLLEIFKAVADLCDANNLCYMLSGGSCLGAVRHKGFIPWDDDLDIMMPREDYQRLLVLLDKGFLQTDYSYLYPNGKQDAPISFLKIYKNKTKLVGLSDDERFPQKVCIDVFPIDGTPSNRLARRLKGIISDGLRFAANTVYDFHPLSDTEIEFYSSDPDLMHTIKIRRFIGRICSIIPHRRWVYWFDRFVSNPTMKEFATIASGRKRYLGELLPSSVFCQTIVATFETELIYIPREWDLYLKNLYGDYMALPSVEKRERHIIRSISLDSCEET